ncbi:WecB/TagA/CpsF family glycosyltransferase [Paracoccus sp. (in: a-proteobacteria)]|uniref:WecB/TagA/CpsF family glycosyltransferase n=1 Tax=Paracoccus sp. TaxID=267 RepID=UPI003A8C36B9
MSYATSLQQLTVSYAPVRITHDDVRTRAGAGHVRLFGLEIANATTGDMITRLLTPGRRSRVAFFNAHCGNVMAKDTEYAEALASADVVLPDGIGVELAARMCGDRLTENLNGTDFVPALLAAAASRGQSVFLLGGRPGVARQAAQKLTATIPGLVIAGTRDGFAQAADLSATISEINASKADIVLVAMGVPMQDVWLARHSRLLHARLTLGVGALFDFLAGRIRRAPLPVRKIKAEWLWRLAMEPRRMARRYLIGNIAFMARAMVHAASLADRDAVTRRVLDIAISASALILLAPVFLLLGLAIRLDSKGPVIFSQTRIGLNGEHYTMFKLRTMRTDAEAHRAGMLSRSDRPGLCFKARNDDRITRIGRFLRKHSLDELPQLLNVLRGQMSMVGPRPALPEEVAAYPLRALERLSVKPGLTGIWQLSGRAEIGFDKMIDMDIAYARARSVLSDLVLIAMTFRAVIEGRGAY